MRITRWWWRWCGALVAVFGFVVSAAAQISPSSPSIMNSPGQNPRHGALAFLPFESVDPLNGGLHLTQTDLVLPGNAGFDLAITRVYSSKIFPDWEAGGGQVLMDPSWVGLGWRLHFGRVVRLQDGNPGVTAIEMPDGSEHPLWNTPDVPEGWITSEYWRFNRATRTLRLPNGLVYTFGQLGPPTHRVGTNYYVTEIRDPFGNRIEFFYLGDPNTPSDILTEIRQHLGNGQVRTVTFGIDSNRTLRTMTYQGRTWTYTHGAADVQGYHVLTQVRGPEAGFNTWTFGYGQPDYGSVMTSLTAPWGGKVTYTYARVPWLVKRPNGDDDDFLYRDSFMVVKRTVAQDHVNAGANGTWTFQYAQGASRNTSIVTTPCGTLTYTFFGLGVDPDDNYAGWRAGLLHERRTLAADGTLLEQELFGWIAGEPVSASSIPGIAPGIWASSNIQPPLLQHVRVIRGPESWLTTHEYHTSATDGNPQTFYNDFGHPWRTTARDLVSGQQRVSTRTFTYGFTPYLTGRAGQETVTIGSHSLSTTRQYDLATGFVTRENAPGQTTFYERTPTGNVGAVMDANKNRTELTYSWGGVAEIRTPGVTTTRSLNPDGTVASETVAPGQPDALTTRYTYDALGRLRHITPPVGHPTILNEENVAGRYVATRRGTQWTRTRLDGFGRSLGTVDVSGLKTEVRYDACGRVGLTSAPYTTTTPRYTNTRYDALDRPVSVTAPDESQTTYAYTGLDVTVTDAEARTTRYEHAAYAGPGDAQLVTVTDAAGTTTRYRYHVSGALARVEGPGAGVVRTWTYDANARLVEEVQPESGRTRYVYDPAGNLTTITNANNQGIGFSYDANNRLVRRTAPETVFVYDKAGRVREQRTGGVTTTVTFDSGGRPTRRSDTGHGFAFSSTYTYDAHDALTQVTYPSGRTVAYDYDDAGRLSRVLMNGQVFATGFTYADNGHLARYTTGAVTHAVTYDARDRVARLKAGPSSAPALDLTYQYDQTSNVTQITDPRPSMTQTFEYDPLQRLARADGHGGWTTFTYDAEGNRTAASYAHGASTAYLYDTATRRLRSTSGTVAETFTYDAAGRLTQDARGTYTYSPVGHLVRAQAPSVDATYQYDADEQRLYRIVNGVTHWTLRSLGSEVLSEYQTRCGTREWVRDTVYAGGRPLGAVRAPRDEPTVSFVWSSSTVAEETAEAPVGVRLTTATGAPLPCPVAVHYETRAGSAAPGRDFTLQAATLTFAAGTASATTKTLSVPVINEASDEDNQGFVVFLTGAAGAQLGTHTRHTVAIVDDDPPPVLTVPSITVAESASQAVFTLTLSAPSGKEVRVTYATAPETAQAGTDYTAVSGTVRLAPGTRTATIHVPLREDGSAEGDESFLLTLSAPVNVTLARTAASATIQDNERPRAPINLTLPGRFFADMTAASTEADYLHIANPYAGISLPVRLTFTRPDGSGVRREFTLGPRQRQSLLLANEPGLEGDTDVSVAVQSRDTRYTVLAEHSHYWGTGWEGGRATEGVEPQSHWYLAEGSTWGFDEWITLFNPSDQPAWVTLEFYLPSGAAVQRRVTIAEGPGRARVHVNDILGATAHHATVLTAFVAGSSTPTPMVVERTMTWQNRLDGHSSPGVDQPASQWGFAEGTTAAATYLALFNPGFSEISVRIDYLHENGTPYTVDVPVPSYRRVTVAAPSWLPAGAFAISVYTLNGAPFVAERMLYAPDQRYGHAGPGQRAGTSWHLVEGTTSSFFDTFLALGNWNAQAITVTIHYSNGGQILKTQTVTVPALSRRTVLVDAVGIGETEFQTQVIGSAPVLVDRITYWPGVATATGNAGAAAKTMVIAPDDESPPRPDTDGGGGDEPKAPHYDPVVTGTPVNDAAVQAAAEGPAPRPAPTAAQGWYGSHLTTGGAR